MWGEGEAKERGVGTPAGRSHPDRERLDCRLLLKPLSLTCPAVRFAPPARLGSEKKTARMTSDKGATKPRDNAYGEKGEGERERGREGGGREGKVYTFDAGQRAVDVVRIALLGCGTILCVLRGFLRFLRTGRTDIVTVSNIDSIFMIDMAVLL